jgi:nucleoside-diphosphate-sugar epimerase
MRALIGSTGFVGSNLLRQCPFEHCYHSTNIDDIRGREYDLIVCAGAPAAKWRANQAPDADRACIGRLCDALRHAWARELVLISTIDVYGRPEGVDEDIAPVEATSYGRHRLELEEFVAAHFLTRTIRLPALFGPGLKKNAIFDLLHNNQVEKLDSRGTFQFYDVGRLWQDIEIARRADLSLVHFATEPTSLAEVAREAFGRAFTNETTAVPARYDFRTRHAHMYGGDNGYLMSSAEVLAALRRFVVAQRALKQCA